jgi:hypothetical protein
VKLMMDLAKPSADNADNVNNSVELACLDLTSIQELSLIDKRKALHDWVKQIARRAPSRARLNALYDLCFVSKTGRGHLKHGEFVLRRFEGRLLAEPINF